MQEGDDEDLPPLEEDVDEGSRMEVGSACHLYATFGHTKKQGHTGTRCRLHPTDTHVTSCTWDVPVS